MTRAETKRRWVALGATIGISTALVAAVTAEPALANGWSFACLLTAQWAANVALDRWASG